MNGRRISVDSITPGRGNFHSALTQPGDYCGPIRGYTGDNPAVWYLLPITEDVPGHPEAKALHHVESPPHRFVEEPDGTLSIYDSIGCGPCGDYYWHGYLKRGVWEKC
jgi:hypothetical protein